MVEGKAIDIVYMNFSKAFEKVLYGRFLWKVCLRIGAGPMAICGLYQHFG